MPQSLSTKTGTSAGRSTTVSAKSTPRRKSTNVTLTVALVSEAKALGVNLSQAAEAGLQEAVASKRAALWIAENREALESSNAFVEAHGLPLAQYRNF